MTRLRLSPAGRIGRFVIGRVLYLLDLAQFTADSLSHGRHLLNWSDRATRRSLVAQIIFTGVDALPLVTLLALAIGATLTTQILSLGEALGNADDVVRLLTLLIGMELGSLLTAIVLIGRTGSAIAVDLGNMKLHGEVEGLELLGVDMMDFFVNPRVLGAAISQVVLAGYFYVIALFGGCLVSGLLVSSRHLAYLQPLLHSFDSGNALIYVIKNLLFGIIIAGTACFHALRVGRSPTEVPQQTQRAVVSSLALIFLLDGVFAIALALRG